MNKVILAGRLGRDPEVRYSQGENATCYARFSLGVNRNFKNSEGNYDTDWITCVAAGKRGEFAEKYLKKGSSIVLDGSIRTGSYTNKDGQKVYTTEVYADNIEFGQGSPKGSSDNSNQSAPKPSNAAPSMGDGCFMNIPDGLDEELPFN